MIQKLSGGQTSVGRGLHPPDRKPLTLFGSVVPADKAALSEKRREPRYPCNDAVAVRVMSIGPRHFPATVLDVSRSGLRLELATPIAKGSEIEVAARTQLVVFGEVRYCRRAGEVFHVGVLIRDVVQSHPRAVAHLHDDEEALYLAGKGLAMADVIRVKDHLTRCEQCRTRLREADAVLHPVRKHNFLGKSAF